MKTEESIMIKKKPSMSTTKPFRHFEMNMTLYSSS